MHLWDGGLWPLSGPAPAALWLPAGVRQPETRQLRPGAAGSSGNTPLSRPRGCSLTLRPDFYSHIYFVESDIRAVERSRRPRKTVRLQVISFSRFSGSDMATDRKCVSALDCLHAAGKFRLKSLVHSNVLTHTLAAKCAATFYEVSAECFVLTPL